MFPHLFILMLSCPDFDSGFRYELGCCIMGSTHSPPREVAIPLPLQSCCLYVHSELFSVVL